MKKIIPWLVGVVTGLLAIGLFYLPGAAQAAPSDGPSFKTCANLRGWVVNDDETDRLPVPTEDGLQFSGDQLIHHVAADLNAIKIGDLKPGSYVADPAPSLDSFFSVEVRDTDGAYATLRWNKKTIEWDAVIKGELISHADPADFVGTKTNWGTITENTKVASFGIGYVAHPNEGTKTVVSEVEFAGHKYPMTCKAASPSPSSSAPSTSTKQPCQAYLYNGTSQNLCDRFAGVDRMGVTCKQVGYRVKLVNNSNDPWGLDGSGGGDRGVIGIGCESYPNKPTPSKSSHPAGGATGGNSGDGGALAITGPSAPKIAIVAVLILAGGAGALYASRRRRTNFSA